MFVKQFYTNSLAEASYYIESGGEVAIIDPLRDIDAYLEMANKRGASIKYIFETHFHSDFISGHLDLSYATGAKIVFGPTSTASFDFHQAKDGEEFALGNLVMRAIHTPGHTLESTCFLLLNENYKPHAIFTGDTLFVGDVGRPDLVTNSELNTSDLAGLLYDSL
ncbi:MAG: MBL fold metallo-hydrolase, partial [Cyclobacteriaceae bacterium]|nr:MBL fold metallo-hydrolase [Cyclobacteriaceae bacterium]